MTLAASNSAASMATESVAKSKIAVSLRGLWKTYPGGANPAVKDLSIDVLDGEILTLLGPKTLSARHGELNRDPSNTSGRRDSGGDNRGGSFGTQRRR